MYCISDRVREGHRHAAQRLGGEHGPVELGAVIADNRRLVVTGEAERGEPEGDEPGLGQVLAPCVRLPDPEVLLPDRHLAPEALGVLHNQLGEGIETRIQPLALGAARVPLVRHRRSHQLFAVLPMMVRAVKGNPPVPIPRISKLIQTAFAWGDDSHRGDEVARV
jgi:hypothetical protein